MFSIEYLMEKLDYSIILGSPSGSVSEVVIDSRKVSKYCLFICIEGFKFDAHSVAADVIAAGASALVIGKDLSEEAMDLARKNNVTLIRVDDTRYAMAFISAAFYGHPADSLKVIGITGTKGKTTTSYLVKNALEEAGVKTGLIGSIETIIGDEHIPSINTTPESFLLQSYFKRMLDAGITTVVMEVASQGLKLHRTQGFTFELGIFTNLEPDHIGPNEHESFEEYIECKSRLFRQCRYGIVNADDPHLLKVIKDHTCQVYTYGFNKDADLWADDLELIKTPGQPGLEFDVHGDVNTRLFIPTPGIFGAYNALCATSICHYFGIADDIIKDALSKAHVKGRTEILKTPYPFTIMIDYAHNAMALESLLKALREYNPKRLIVLFGCGGNRSKDRRYGMGEVAGKYADLSVITSDNPRDEDPQSIIDDIKEGIKPTGGKYVEIINRREAIRYVIENGKRNDMIVLAGKGHEDYQEIKGVKYPMDERVIVKEIISQLEDQ
ncbi:MAG: UDP-N-acetylmuramoyl-L-alanyl-D-glutamate--2,6-diaminopimelate ligase [Lachnospiraceae bacterium]|nr:UDP-N-acetylmuramoyl-L-alanyl-D-glutamate--2,6-diaminopimelate ligase [Lachnospiraceae bacterium]